MRTMIFTILILLVATIAIADQEIIFSDGDPIVGATFFEGEYKLGDAAYIDLNDLIDRHTDRVVFTYKTGVTLPSGGTVWNNVAAEYQLTNEDAIEGLSWLDVFPWGMKRLYFRSVDERIRGVEVRASKREPGVPNTFASVGTVKARY